MAIPLKLTSDQLLSRGFSKEEAAVFLSAQHLQDSINAGQAIATASAASIIAAAKAASFQQASAPTNPTGGYTLQTADEWVSTDTTTNCPDLNCTGRSRNSAGAFSVALGTAAPHGVVNWHHLWNGTAWKDAERKIISSEIVAGSIAAGAITAGAIQAGAIVGQGIATSNFAESGGTVSAGALLDGTSTSDATPPVRMSAAGMQIGSTKINAAWFAQTYPVIARLQVTSGGVINIASGLNVLNIGFSPAGGNKMRLTWLTPPNVSGIGTFSGFGFHYTGLNGGSGGSADPRNLLSPVSWNLAANPSTGFIDFLFVNTGGSTIPWNVAADYCITVMLFSSSAAL